VQPEELLLLRPPPLVLQAQRKRVLVLYLLDGSSASLLKADHTLSTTTPVQLLGSIPDDSSSSES